MFSRPGLVVAIIIVCGCSQSAEPPLPEINSIIAKNSKVKPVSPPFMEHPTGEFKTATDAMADAIKRLRALSERKDWIMFTAQGMGDRVDSYRFAVIRMRQDSLEFDKPIDVDIDLVTKRAGVPQTCLSKNGNIYSVASATPIQAARVMDAIFRQHLGIRPHQDEGNDYAVGAEW